MELKVLKPRKALNKAFLKLKPNRNQIEHFKTNLTQLLDRTNNTESEEFHKNLVSEFLKKTYYEPNHFINTKGRNDLVIHNGDKAKSTVGVIIEAKKPTNKSEMLTKDKINVKAFQELVLYYLRERITLKNLEVKHLIATNINEWFIFDAHIFEKYFAHNKVFVKQFNEFENERLAGKSTDFFYKEIAAPFIDNLNQEIEFTYFDIRRYEKPLRNENPKDDTLLIALFKLLSPEHLLKLPFTNDSNSLDKSFYGELLHIIGLSEIKQGSKKLIERNKEGQRNTGSLLENAIIQLDSLDKISRLDKPAHFGDTQQERLFNIGLELCITWVNRILFLKLLEAQLLTYHNGDKSFEYLSLDKIPNYDDLNSLFFQVLARKLNDRNDDVKTIFEKVPYLNSSLFDPTDLEHKTIFISNLRDDKTIPIYSSTVLKDDKGKKRTGKLSTLQYLFEFLNAYDFSSEGSEEIQEENKTLINASVLGLIFEKINGYKDGSFFTPGFITMYMCRETIRKAVVQKFNETKNWDCNNIESLYDKIENRQEANEIVNSLKICDPAVGSGHFLVSALNEIIAIKNDLKILQDRAGRRLKEYQVEVVNDELIVTDEDGELFEYKPASPESSRVQQALFHEKQTIIENCLFGVDINTNSVKICRLRLWIELLKNAYYISPSTSSSPEKGSWHEAGETSTSSSPEKGSWHEAGETSTSSSPEKGRWPKAGGVHNLPHLKHFRKELRKNLTPAEATLWRMLQQKKLDGRKFRRQHSVGNYILDFYCPAERLAIELDGEVHNNVSAQEYDLERDLFLKHFGIKVLRFENRMVFEQPEMVLEAIRLEFGKNEPPRPQADTPPFKGGELQTLPNIDINIKCGNSLISRFAIDADLGKALNKSKWTIDSYRLAVDTYRNAQNKEQKREMEKLISDIKSDFRSEISLNDPRVKRLKKISGEIFTMANQTQMFEMTKKEKTEWNTKLKKLSLEEKKLEAQIEEIKSNVIYENAFEWRFEFPEVLNDKGDFVGFDVVMGNPPYGVKAMSQEKKYFKEYYESIIGKFDSYGFFIEKGIIILKSDGQFGFIIPHTWLTIKEAQTTRDYLLANCRINEINQLPSRVFEDATVETTNLFLTKQTMHNNYSIKILAYNLNSNISQITDYETVFEIPVEIWKSNRVFNLKIGVLENKILQKLNRNSVLLNEICDLSVGIQAYDSYAGQDKDLIEKRVYHSNTKQNNSFIKELNGKDIDRFTINWSGKSWVSYGEWLAHPRQKKYFDRERILVREITAKGRYSIIASIANEYMVNYKSILNVISRNLPSYSFDLKFILGIINSSLMSWYFNINANKIVTNIFPRISIYDLKSFPINLNNLEIQNQICDVVDQIISDKNKNIKIDITVNESQIDQLVYQLYGLTEEEIGIVEEGVK